MKIRFQFKLHENGPGPAEVQPIYVVQHRFVWPITVLSYPKVNSSFFFFFIIIIIINT